MRRLILTAVLVLAALFAAACPIGCATRKALDRQELESLSVGMEATPVNSLVYIAENRGYFAANALKVTINDDYPSGAAAAERMVSGEVDVATAAELAVVRQAFAHEPVRAFASIDKFMHQYLVGRQDRGIRRVQDLRGRMIGVPLGTGAQFNFDRFLRLNGIDREKVDVVDVQAPQAVGALTSGSVDAVVAWQPNVATLKRKLAGNVTTWSVQNEQPAYCVAVTTEDWSRKHPETIKRFLRSLAQAQDFVVEDPAKAKAIVQERLNYEDAYIDEIWPEHELSLSLDESLVLAMKDQARWLMSNGLTDVKNAPALEEYIYADGLEGVKPEAVRIIR